MSTVIIPVIKFSFKSDFKVLEDALNMSPAFEVEDISSAGDLATFLSTIPAGLVIASLREKEDLIQIATFMKTIKKAAQTTAIKMVVINFSGDKQFEKAIAKLGIQDLVEPAINTKALKFKLDFWMKSLNGQIKNTVAANQGSTKSSDTKKEDKKSAENQGPVWLDPLDLEEDIWILNQDSDCKKILSKWLVRLLGPSPYIGQWTDVKNNLWRFDIKESEKDMYVPGNGAWFFFGDQKPDFVWKENLWLITGDNFDLFYKNGDQVSSRMKAKDRTLQICKNSLFAKTKETIILESFDKELVFKKEADSLADLEGKGKTDSLSGGPLSGKGKTSHMNGGPLSGDVNPEDALLSTDPLSQKTTTAREKTHWQGKNAYEKDQGGHMDAPAPEGVREGSELGLDRKNTDHQKHYKGHNPAEQFEAEAKEQERKFREETSEDMSGKSSTDKLKGHYGGANKEAEAKKKSDELSGKSSTDKLDSHYNTQAPEASQSSSEQKRPNRSSQDSSDTSESSRTSLQKDRETNASYGMNEKSKDAQAGASIDQADPYADLFGKSRERKTEELKKNRDLQTEVDFSEANLGDLISLDKARTDKNRQDPREAESLEEVTASAKIISKLTQNNKQTICQLDDFFDETIIFSTSDLGIKDGPVKLELLFQYLGKDNKLNLDGNVSSVDEDGEGHDYVTVEINQSYVEEVEAFMQLFQTRQKNIQLFMQKVRGF